LIDIRLQCKQDKTAYIEKEDGDPTVDVLVESHLTTITFKWAYSEETEEIEERCDFSIDGQGPLYFCSNALKWEAPSKKPAIVTSWTPHHLFFLRQGLWWFLDLYDADAYDIALKTDFVGIKVIFDSQAGHPFLTIRDKKWVFSGRGVRRNGEERSYRIYLYPLSTKKPTIPIINRFPDDYQAAFCITDHADYDQVGPLRAVFWGDSEGLKERTRGLSGRGLRITKSVFARSFPEYTGVGILDDRELNKLIHCLYDEGHEIIPHAIRSYPGTAIELRKDFQHAFRKFKPKTWIDHYYSYATLLPHNFATKGLQPTSPYYIWPLLRDEGIDLLWSGFDIHNNPPNGKLNAFDLSDSFPVSYIRRSVRSLITGNINEAGYFFLEFIDALLGRDMRIELKQTIRSLQSGNISRLKTLHRLSYILGQMVFSLIPQCKNGLNQINRRQVQLFSEKNQFPGDGSVGTFCTMRLNQLGRGLSPERWKDVFQNRGVVLLHTYLACEHSLQDNAWKRVGNSYRITKAFDEATEFLSEQVRQGLLWNPTVHEMWKWYKEWKKVRLAPDAKTGKWKILNQPKRGKINYIVSKKDTI